MHHSWFLATKHTGTSVGKQQVHHNRRVGDSGINWILKGKAAPAGRMAVRDDAFECPPLRVAHAGGTFGKKRKG